jgi:hypothetical protein
MTKEEAVLLITTFHKNFNAKQKYLFDNLVLVGRTSLIFCPEFHKFYVDKNTLYFTANSFEIFQGLASVLTKFADISYNSSYGLHYALSFSHGEDKFRVVVMSPTLADGVLLTDYMRRAAHPLAPGAGISFNCLKPEVVMNHWFKH